MSTSPQGSTARVDRFRPRFVYVSSTLRRETMAGSRTSTSPGGYAEFRIGDYQHELGLIDSSYAPHDTTGGPAGVVLYWHVDDVAAAVVRLTALGATEHDGVRERGAGFVTASVVDPFGNILGVMPNPHYREVLAGR